jgi:hypothetical protein
MHRRLSRVIATVACVFGAACSDPPPVMERPFELADFGGVDATQWDDASNGETGGVERTDAEVAGLGGGDASRFSPPGVVRLTGTATAASCLMSPAGEDVTRLTDGDVNTKFLAFSSTLWAVFDAGAPYTLSRYALTSANDFPERDPARWVLEGSSNAVDWTPLDRQSGQRFTGRLERHEHTVSASAFYRWYRLHMENAGGGVTQVAELELFGTSALTMPAVAPPRPPVALRAQPVSRTQVALDWADTSDDEALFRIERADDGARFAAVGYVPADVTRFVVAGLNPGGRASYRVVAENAAGVSPAAEVVEASPEPALVAQPGGGGLVYQDSGYALTVIDDAPGLTPTWTVSRIVEAFFATYPRMAADFNPTAPRGVIVQLDPRYDGVAEASGEHIRISATYLAAHPDDIDLTVHEGFHVVQAYRAGNTPGWAVEGLADYARWAYGTHNDEACWTLQRFEPGQNYTDAYGVTARFFLWLAQRSGTALLRDLDATLRGGLYDESFWLTRTGVSVDALWAAYADDPMHPAVGYP